MRWLALCLGLLAAAPAGAGAEYTGRFIWTMKDDAFGGLSGIELSPDGGSFTAIGDRGIILTGRLSRGEQGITGVSVGPILPLRDAGNRPLPRRAADAEGLAIAADGTLYISFEGDHRVMAFARPGGPGRSLPRHPDFTQLQGNSGLEALAIDGDGALWAVPERSGEWDRPFPVFRYRRGGWDRPFDLPRRGRYLPVGADFGPDGRFYLLERDFAGVLRGVSSRVRAFRFDAQGLAAEEQVLVTDYGRFDNLEAIGVWRGADGALRLTLLSDDNFNALQRTEFVEFRLRE